MPTVTVSSKGWVVIPAGYRGKYRIRPGAKIEVVDYGGGMSLVPMLPNPIADAQGLLKGRRSLSGALLKERAKEHKREASR